MLIAVVAIQLIIGQSPLFSYRSVTDTLHSTHWSDTTTLIAAWRNCPARATPAGRGTPAGETDRSAPDR